MISTASSRRQTGVVIVLDRETANKVTKIVLHSERLILVKVKTEPVVLVIIQIFANINT